MFCAQSSRRFWPILQPIKARTAAGLQPHQAAGSKAQSQSLSVTGVVNKNAHTLIASQRSLSCRCTDRLLLRFKFQAPPPSPGGTMLRGAEWIRRVKINAHSCSERKQPKRQLCTTGGGGPAWYSEPSEALSLWKEGSAGCLFLECASFLRHRSL